MIVERNISLKRLFLWAGPQLLIITIWAVFAVKTYEFTGLSEWLAVPWLPLSLVGTAVAFYVGFKNNSAYDRMWEARKIWGGIVNGSRAWGTTVKAFISNQFTDQPLPEQELQDLRRKIIYRHLAWLYALRSQLLALRTWEHRAQRGHIGNRALQYRTAHNVNTIDEEPTQEQLRVFLENEELERLMQFKNVATQLIDGQSAALEDLRARGLINDFRHMELQKMLTGFYEQQGKAERIKNYPLPRQYANSSQIFVRIFLFVLPFCLAYEFKDFTCSIWWSIPFTVLVGWIFSMMETIGDFSESPFQGLANDIPMHSLCRTIEIDLREMLGETELPIAIPPKDGILM